MTSTTSRAAILDMDVFSAVKGDYAKGFHWEVFDARAAVGVLDHGTASTREAAEVAAARAISARTLHVRAGRDCWTVEVPDLGAVPLPLTLRATLDDALAHVRALPLAIGRQVHGR